MKKGHLVNTGKTNPIQTQNKPNPPARYAIRNTRYEIQTQSNPTCSELACPACPEPAEGSLGVYPEPKGREGVEPISKAKKMLRSLSREFLREKTGRDGH